MFPSFLPSFLPLTDLLNLKHVVKFLLLTKPRVARRQQTDSLLGNLVKALLIRTPVGECGGV